LRVLWVSHRSGLAGAERALVEAVVSLAPRGVTSTVVLPREGPLRAELERAGARVKVVPHVPWTAPRRRLRHAARDLASLPALARLARGADVVVSNSMVVAVGLPAARLARRRHVWFVHELGLRAFEAGFWLGERATLRAVASSDAVLANSEAVRSFLTVSGTVKTPIRVAHYAVDVPDLPREPVPGRLVLVGTLAPAKGQADAIRALPHLPGRTLRLVGPDPYGYGDELGRLADELGAAVELIGFSPDPARELARAEVALTCARDEAFGRTTVEAMKLGVPVVAAASGGTLELVRDGETGLLYPPGDAEALAERIGRLAADPALASTLAGAAREWSRATFTRERYARALADAFALASSDAT
jgi:glycosyltransferase involved in cell wall biosynthesis